MKPTQFLLSALISSVALNVAVFAEPAAKPSEVDLKAARALGDAFASVAERVKPAVVSIHSTKTVKLRRFDMRMPFGGNFPFRHFFNDDDADDPPQSQPREYKYHQGGLGSGMIIDKDGHILTNNHVVNDVDEIKVTLPDKRTFGAAVTGTDPRTDLAIIKLKGTVPSDLPVAELGNSDTLRVGEWVLAIGAPFGYEQTVTAGIISAKGRANVADSEMFQDFLQTDTAINPGNSGGPLVDLDGKVIGINTIIATSTGQNAGVGFAVPINMAKQILPTLVKGGKVSRGMLGVVIQEVTEDLAKHFKVPESKGALVAQVTPNSAAEKAGIKIYDVIIRYDGKPVGGVSQFRNLVAATAPAARVEIVLLRDGKELTVKAQLGELAAEPTAAAKPEKAADGVDLGLTVEPLTAANARQYGFDKGEGLLITDVEEGGVAALAGIQAGNLITEINRVKVTTLAEYRQVLAKANDTVLVLLKVSEGGSRFVILRVR
ncbi:MAG: Do family serine endopeptidase [Verrucomicrobiota bacterium]